MVKCSQQTENSEPNRPKGRLRCERLVVSASQLPDPATRATLESKIKKGIVSNRQSSEGKCKSREVLKGSRTPVGQSPDEI